MRAFLAGELGSETSLVQERNILPAFAQRRQVNAHDIQTVEQRSSRNLPSAHELPPGPCSSQRPRARRRVTWSDCCRRARTVRSPRARAAASPAMAGVDLADLVEKQRPADSASSKRPTRRSVAPVKEPFSWPKSSLSSNCGLRVRRSARGQSVPFAPRCSAVVQRLRAMSSLPVPLSPSMSTVARVGATCRMVSNTSSIGALVPMIVSNPLPERRSTCCRSSLFSVSTSRPRSARWMRMSSLSRLTGLVTKSYAPRFMASTAVSTLP